LHFKILIVEENPDIYNLLSLQTVSDKYQIVTSNNFEDTINKASKNIDIIILNDFSEHNVIFDICIAIRKKFSKDLLPIIIIRETKSDIDELYAFSIGCNDYLVKPVSKSKLIVRINLWKKLFIRTNNHTQALIDKKKAIKIDEERIAVFVDGNEINLSKIEYEILNFFVKNPNKVFHRSKLIKSIWGESIELSHRTIDVHIQSIRKKLGARSDSLKTVRGFGYMLVD